MDSVTDIQMPRLITDITRVCSKIYLTTPIMMLVVGLIGIFGILNGMRSFDFHLKVLLGYFK